MAAGTYTSRLRWLKHTRTTDATNGQQVETHAEHPTQPYLWCSVEETAGRRTADIGATQTGVEVEIRVRNYPAVNVLDMLQDEGNGYVYHLETVRNGDNEVIIEGYRNDTLEDYDITGD